MRVVKSDVQKLVNSIIKESGPWCLRCGEDKKEIRRLGINACNVYGTIYKRHIFKATPTK